jgi:hypothetical protein
MTDQEQRGRATLHKVITEFNYELVEPLEWRAPFGPGSLALCAIVRCQKGEEHLVTIAGLRVTGLFPRGLTNV